MPKPPPDAVGWRRPPPPSPPPAPLPRALPPQELLGPGNLENLTLAAEDAGKSMPVHVYLYNHYADPWGFNFTTPAELQARRAGGESAGRRGQRARCTAAVQPSMLCCMLCRAGARPCVRPTRLLPCPPASLLRRS